MSPLYLILLKGHPGTGKSTLGRTLAQRLEWPLVDKDDVKDFIAELPSGNSLAYEVAWRIAGTQLSLGISAIVDTPLSYPTSYQRGRALAAAHGAGLLVIETVLDEPRWQQRLEARRTGEPSAHKISSWTAMQDLLQHYNNCWQYPIDPAHHLRVDTGRAAGSLVEEICRRLGMGAQR